MWHAAKHGLYGKARLVHRRSRVARAYAAQTIHEELELDSPSPRIDRLVPISGRSEFLPSFSVATQEAPSGRTAQLELPLEKREARRSAVVDSGIDVSPQRSDARPVPHRKVEPAPPVHRAAEWNSLPILQARKKERRLSPGWFLWGCAVGSAGAAILLLVLQLIFG